MIHLLYSADYELYLGGNHLPETEVLIPPTDRLLQTCKTLQIPLTLFVDNASLWRHRQWGADHFVEAAENQLRQAITQGHDVQAHLHPHWLETERAGHSYRFDPKSYLLGHLDPDPELCELKIKGLLDRSVEYFTQLLSPLSADYRCIAFRAGGYGLQPRENILLKALQESGFRIDSSIIPGRTIQNPYQQVDFSQVPNQANYWLSEQSGLSKPAPKGKGLFEIPIPSYHMPDGEAGSINRSEAIQQAARILLTGASGPPPRGVPCNAPPQAPRVGRLKQAWWRWHALLKRRHLHLELSTDANAMLRCLTGYLEPFDPAREDIYLSLNSHPKGVTSRHLTALKHFHQKIQHHFGHNLQAITFQEAARRIERTTP
ncbi:MAG: hypothetical protein HQL52_16770 [Magnetococcales bacterium]|nr:hypothetical protein [Magnetococcales bacterium]